jgi:hypothetical protein
MSVRPAVIAREGLLRHTLPRHWSLRSHSRWGRQPPPICRSIRQHFVGGCERRDHGHECKVGSGELLQHGQVVGSREHKVIKRQLKSVDCWRCLNCCKGPAEGLTSTQGKDLALAFDVRETEGRLPRTPGP